MEKYLKDKKVGTKLRTAFLGILAMFILTSVIAICGILIINGRMANFYNKPYVNAQLQQEIRKNVQLTGKNLLWAVVADAATTQERIALTDASAADVSAGVEQLAKTFDNKELMTRLQGDLEQLKAIRASVVEQAAKLQNEAALKIFDNEYMAITEQIQDTLIEIGKYSDKEAADAYSLARNIGFIAEAIMVVLVVLGIFLCLTMTKVITKSICTPVAELQEAADKLVAGALDEIEIAYESKDELGSLANNFRAACQELKDVIADVRFLLEEMANGNFNVRTKNEAAYVGNFQYMLGSIRVLNRNLDSTLRQINEGSEQVAIGSEQMADSAQSLAEGATDQAGAVEELTATVENVTSISEQNAEAAQGAAAKVMEAVEEAEESRTEMQNLNEAMERISETSKEIEDIIGAIEDIASQTNLLSLNASIEAARAGEAGRGFAVVADQIGKLAADSAQSAVTTRELIGKSLAEIQTGNEITARSTEKIGSVLASIEEFSKMASSSAESSQVQSDMLEQVRDGIEQISTVIQNNSAAAEETSAVSEELSAQSENLKALVSQFKLREE